MGSCLWDITRYGPNGISVYDKSLEDLFRAFKIVLPWEAMLIWATALPVGVEVHGGVILEKIKFMGDFLRLDVLMANFLASKVGFFIS